MQLQEVFENYKKEKAENDKLLNEQNEKLQEQVTDLRSQNAKISHSWSLLPSGKSAIFFITLCMCSLSIGSC